MAFSGTTSQTTFDTRKVIERAYARCRVPAALISAEQAEDARDTLYLLLSELSNRHTPLWAVEKKIYPVYEGKPVVACATGTVDVINAYSRTLSEATGTNTDASTSRIIDFSTDTAISTVGIKWSAASVALTFARSDDNVTWTDIQSETPTEGSGEWSWYDMQQVIAARYFRISSASTINFSSIVTGNNPSETMMARLNRDQFQSMPDKTSGGRPLNYWFDRQSRQPVMRLWPVPNSTYAQSQVVAWQHRHVMDVGTLAQEIEVPQRWYEAIVAGLAAKLALETPEVSESLIPLLDQKAELALRLAERGDTDGSPVTIMPDISAYTR